jgi:hypothetical protein
VRILRAKIFYHNNCFDGACSASVFTRFHRECIAKDTTYQYQGLVHGPSGLFNESEFDGDENAIVDFKYFTSPRLTWWFDHHISAFLTDADREDFERGQRDGSQTLRKFFDPDYISCTGFIADIAREKFGWDTAPLKDLIYWANIVDGAKYESAQSAVEMAAPAMKLTLVIESTQDPKLIPRIIPMLTAMPLEEIVAQPFIAEQITPLLARHREQIDLLAKRATLERGTITYDITDQSTEAISKFIPYYLFPDAVYTVGLSRSSFRVKISIGTNPWTTVPVDKLINLAPICERYGGGGHARVGAASFPLDRLEEARAAAAEVAAELRGEGVAS